MKKIPLNQKGVSLYYQVEQSIRSKIESGEWQAGYRLPTELQLCEYFNVSRTTLRQAVDSLVENGFLVRRQGSGTYVSLPTYSRNRMSTQPSSSVCKYIYNPILQDDIAYSYTNMLNTHIAHVLMLQKQSLIPRETAQKILEFILSIRDKTPSTIGANPLNEDLILNFEQYCITHLGIDTAGNISIARSRNDMIPTIIRMNLRDMILPVYKSTLSIIHKLQDMALANRGHLIGVYTHTMLGQPVTMEFYLLSIAYALERNLEKFLNLYGELNLSPLGACGCSGTSYPIDRRYTCKLLGFDHLITNALDAVATRDFVLDIAAAYAALGVTISRFVQDLYLWSTEEFDYISFLDSVCCGSSLMPQKKNAVVLEHIKSKTAHLAGAHTEITVALKGTGFSHCRDLFECTSSIYTASYNMTAILSLLEDVLNSINFHYDSMRKRLERSNSTATDIADHLVQQKQYSFRSAHNIVSSAVKDSSKAGAEKLSAKALNASLKHYSRASVTISEEELKELSDPSHSILMKKSEGSPGLSSCIEMQNELNYKLERDEETLQAIIDGLVRADNYLSEEIHSMLS